MFFVVEHDLNLSKGDFHQCDFYVSSDFNQGKLITYDSLTVGES